MIIYLFFLFLHNWYSILETVSIATCFCELLKTPSHDSISFPGGCNMSTFKISVTHVLYNVSAKTSTRMQNTPRRHQTPLIAPSRYICVCTWCPIQ
jgi:hypothetical protein